METLNLSIDARWAAGLVLAITRVAAFAAVSPLLARAMPATGRIALALGLGAFLASDYEGSLALGGLFVAAVVNSFIGAALGWTTGLIFHIFAIAGNIIDLSSGLSVAMIIDPTIGEQGAIFGRLFNLTALALFYVSGGLELLVSGLALSVEAIPLHGELAYSAAGFADLAAQMTGRILLAGAELALPVVAALFLTEVVLGLASRFAPQANVFLLGLPAKLLIALTLLSASIALFPEAMGGVLRVVQDTFVNALAGLGAGD